MSVADGARLVDGNNGQMLLLSMRQLSDLVANCMLYEFEDLVAQLTGADRVEAAAVAVLERSRRSYRLLRLASGSAALARRFALQPSTVRLERDYELFFPTFNHTHELYTLATVPDWRRRCRFAACYINEVWVHLLPRYLLELLSQFDHVYIGMRHCVAEVGRIVGRPCSYLPLAVDVLRFAPWPEVPVRNIDVCNIGRRSPVTHEALLRLGEARRIFYYYDTFAGQSGSKQRTFRVSRSSEHRLLLAGLMQRSRYYVANRARINEPEYTGEREEMSGRFYEGAAAGTVMLGEAPNSADFRELFGWPDAVIRMPFDCPDVAQLLASLDTDQDRLARIRRQNVHHAALSHDWLHRLQTVFAQFGIAPTPGMIEREQRLRSLAALALTGQP
jgi:hypothetical protein